MRDKSTIDMQPHFGVSQSGTHFCKVDGVVWEYAAAGEKLHKMYTYNTNFEYIGKGWIYEINGVSQEHGRESDNTILHFWRRKSVQQSLMEKQNE